MTLIDLLYAEHVVKDYLLIGCAKRNAIDAAVYDLELSEADADQLMESAMTVF